MKWRKCILSSLMGLILIGIMIGLDTTVRRVASNLMVIEILKVGGWMLLWNGLQTFVYEILVPNASGQNISQPLEANKNYGNVKGKDGQYVR